VKRLSADARVDIPVPAERHSYVKRLSADARVVIPVPAERHSYVKRLSADARVDMPVPAERHSYVKRYREGQIILPSLVLTSFHIFRKPAAESDSIRPLPEAGHWR